MSVSLLRITPTVVVGLLVVACASATVPASILAIAPDSTVLSITTIIEP